MWKMQQIGFELETDMTDHPVCCLDVTTPAGLLTVIGELSVERNWLRITHAHIQGAERNLVGMANLMVMARAVMEGMNFDGIVIAGAVRTTGARPGHQPRIFRLARDRGH